ncbi:uncharacterized protein LOC114448803 [Parambassis ranga]|uniref:Uncharacterized protein LOC114448803 n=1 Tax=Parambassis ranga TaxID=210632 RepID=A0A6P7JXT7_9TELE|nr:uncharacterized protein LOC114448803 [Parambassis ranga]
MSAAAVKDKGPTLVTMATGTLRPVRGVLRVPCCISIECVLAAFGTVQIMIGLFNIALGPGRTSTHPEDLSSLGAAYWLGAVFIFAGIVSIFTGCFANCCIVCFTVSINILGAIFSIIAIWLYAVDLENASITWMCNYGWISGDANDDNCRNVAYFAQKLLTGMDMSLIILAVLQLCVCISFSILGIYSLVCTEKEKDVPDVQIIQPVLKEVLMTSPGA